MQSSHCIGWARALFDRIFSQDAGLLKSLLLESGSESVQRGSIDSLPAEDVEKVFAYIY